MGKRRILLLKRMGKGRKCESMRLFMTADLPGDVVESLRDNLDDVRQSDCDGKLTSKDNLHVTLAFLGEQLEDQLDVISSAMEQACHEVVAFDVALGDYGCFGKVPSATLWQGFDDSGDLEALAKALREALRDRGIHFDEKPFVPHVTLARRWEGSISDLEEPWVDEGILQSISLYWSHLSSEGPTYERIQTFELRKPYEHPDGRLLIVDADACPDTKEALAEARRACIPVLLVGNGTQNLEKHLKPSDSREPKKGFWAATMNVAGGADSADFQIATVVKSGDVVVTQDIGVAAMALGAGAAAIGVRGREYAKAAIDAMLLVRHEEKKVRRAGGRTQGPAAFTNEDRSRFARKLRWMLEREEH